MELTSAGTAIMLAIAAGLWFLYLVPTWVRRREYLATERTATRLQQTMRVLAETAEVPDAVRVSATARDAARAERLLRAQQRRADAMVARQVRAERAATPASLPRSADPSRRDRGRPATPAPPPHPPHGEPADGRRYRSRPGADRADRHDRRGARRRGSCSAVALAARRRGDRGAARPRCAGDAARRGSGPVAGERGRCRASCRCVAPSTRRRGRPCPCRSRCTSRSRRCSG